MNPNPKEMHSSGKRCKMNALQFLHYIIRKIKSNTKAVARRIGFEKGGC
jgi:hypothetical protein